MGKQAFQINPEDRLFHLILALMASKFGLTKDQIFSSVRGYREAAENSVDKSSIERRFERDKDALKELGIPLEVSIPPQDDNDNKLTIYRIRKEAYELPSDIQFSGSEIAMLNLAATIWREGSLAEVAQVATRKLQAFGVKVDEPLIGFAPLVTARDPQLERIREAIDKNSEVVFQYLKPSAQEAEERTVLPLALVNFEGRWHLYGHEKSVAQKKTFLLRRIVSAISNGAVRTFETGQNHAEEALRELNSLFAQQCAEILVVAESDASVILSQRAGTEIDGQNYRVHFTDEEVFASELASFGNDAVVNNPDSLRERVIAKFRAAAGEGK